MTQSEFIRIMAVRQGLSQECVRRLVGALLDSLEEGLAEGASCAASGRCTSSGGKEASAAILEQGKRWKFPRTGSSVSAPRIGPFPVPSRPPKKPTVRPLSASGRGLFASGENYGRL